MTITVSACKEGHKKDCDMLSNVGIPSAQKDESYCTCGKTTKVKPTVEKWERKPKNLEQAIINLYKNVFERGMKISEHNFVMAIEDLMTQYATHSVQEAKAEERREMLSLLTVILTHSSMHSTHNKYCASCDLKKAIDEFLSTLNTKEDK